MLWRHEKGGRHVFHIDYARAYYAFEIINYAMNQCLKFLPIMPQLCSKMYNCTATPVLSSSTRFVLTPYRNKLLITDITRI